MKSKTPSNYDVPRPLGKRPSKRNRTLECFGILTGRRSVIRQVPLKQCAWKGAAVAAAGILAALSAVTAVAAEQDTTRPNIVFAFADDWGRYASAYSAHEGPNSLNALIDTPNFDRIADEGLIFQNAFVPAPSCTPCRSSILSGRYFWQTGRGAILQEAVWDETIPSYPLELEKAGYHIGYAYKVWSPGQPVDAPYGGWRKRRYTQAGQRFNSFSQAATISSAWASVWHIGFSR